MTNSSASGKVSGYRSAFSQTCNLLSQYVKEKKAIGDLSLGMFGNGDERGQNDMFHPTTMNLFPFKNKLEEPTTMSNGNSVGLFPQQAGFAAPSSEIQSSPMTIFYAGQVIVFNDFPAQKAKEIIELAGRGIPQTSSTNTLPVVAHANTTNPDSTNMSPAMKNTASTTTPIITDLSIPRKASLHRFLEKRKDRIKVKAPYSTSKAGDMPSEPSEGNPWLGLGAVRPSSLQSRE